MILFGTTWKSNNVQHASYQYHFTIFLHFAIEIKNKEQTSFFRKLKGNVLLLCSLENNS